MADKVSLVDAVAYLAARGDAVERSTLSRYLKQHADAIEVAKSGRATLVDPEALFEHRRENIRLKDSRAPAGVQSAGQEQNRTQATSVARKAEADAQIKELQLAKELKLLTPTAEIEEIAREAVAQMRGAFDTALNQTSELIAARLGGDARAVRPILKGMVRAGLTEFSRAMGELASIPEVDEKQG